MFWDLDVLSLDVLGLDILVLDVLGYHLKFQPFCDKQFEVLCSQKIRHLQEFFLFHIIAVIAYIHPVYGGIRTYNFSVTSLLPLTAIPRIA